MSNNKDCCKDCPEREVGCHAVCEKYLAFHEERTKTLERIREARKKDDAYIDYFLKNYRKRLRRSGRK